MATPSSKKCSIGRFATGRCRRRFAITFLWGARSIVIAGTHGKTTTTSLTGWVLTHGGVDPSMLVGGVALNFGDGGSSYRIGSGRDFVIEGDEYDSAFFDKTAKFLKYLPDIAVINNVEFDHADIYADFDAVSLAFRRLVNLVPRNGLLLLGADSPGAHALVEKAVSRVETFGLGEDVDWQAHDVVAAGTSTRFKVRRNGMPFAEFEVPLVGPHNVRNALAAIAVATDVGIAPERIGEGTCGRLPASSAGSKSSGRRSGVTVYDDFAHHPTAVAETLAGLRASHPAARIWAVFEPRSASSCRRVFQDDFARAFGGADEVLLAPVFRSTLPEAERLSIPELVRDLRARGQSAREADSIDDIIDAIVSDHRPGDLVVMMSNGAFGGIHGKLLQALARPHERLPNRPGGRLRAHRRVRGPDRSGRSTRGAGRGRTAAGATDRRRSRCGADVSIGRRLFRSAADQPRCADGPARARGRAAGPRGATPARRHSHSRLLWRRARPRTLPASRHLAG